MFFESKINVLLILNDERIFCILAFLNTITRLMKKLLLTLFGILIPWLGSLSAQTYCAAGPSSTFDSEITGVVLNGTGSSISQLSSACGTTGVQDFTATDIADLQINTSY